MTDKEVGQLWADMVARGFDFSSDDITRKLIRKLVEERAYKNAIRYYKVHGPDDDAVKSCIKTALRDFGIDPETWK